MRLTKICYNFLPAAILSLTVSLTVGLSLVPTDAHAGGIPMGHNAINADLGFSTGGADLGLDYEYGYTPEYSIGAYLRVMPDNTGSTLANGVTTFGAFIRPHFSKSNWDFYVSPGFGFTSYKLVESSTNTKNYTVLGPSFALGLLYDLTPNMSIGVEQMSIYSWWNSSVPGELNQNLTAKFRFIF